MKSKKPGIIEFPTIQFLKETIKPGLEDLMFERKPLMSSPEPTLREVVNITGARKAWGKPTTSTELT